MQLQSPTLCICGFLLYLRILLPVQLRKTEMPKSMLNTLFLNIQYLYLQKCFLIFFFAQISRLVRLGKRHSWATVYMYTHVGWKVLILTKKKYIFSILKFYVNSIKSHRIITALLFGQRSYQCAYFCGLQITPRPLGSNLAKTVDVSPLRSWIHLYLHFFDWLKPHSVILMIQMDLLAIVFFVHYRLLLPSSVERL